MWINTYIRTIHIVFVLIILIKSTMHWSGGLLFIYVNGKMSGVFFYHTASHFGYDCDPVKDPIVLPSYVAALSIQLSIACCSYTL